MDKELEDNKNSDFSLEAKFKSMIKMANEIIKNNNSIGDCSTELALAYDVVSYLPKLLDNSIPKETIEKYLENEKELFETYKKESKTNENLKMGLWKHIGAKNMCERILEIEKTVTTLDEGE